MTGKTVVIESRDLRHITNEELCKKYCAAYYCLDPSMSTIEAEMRRRGLTEQELLEFGSIAQARHMAVRRRIDNVLLRPIVRFAMRYVVWLSKAIRWMTVKIEKVAAWLTLFSR